MTSNKPLSLYAQEALLLKLFPDSDSRINNSVLKWIVHLKPSELSDTYKVELSYRLGDRPDVIVLEPELQILEGEKGLPHVFKGDFLCLFYSKFNEWHAGMAISNTLVPWISEWLFFYEIWLATGEWHGGGIHPKKRKKESFSQSIRKRLK